MAENNVGIPQSLPSTHHAALQTAPSRNYDGSRPNMEHISRAITTILRREHQDASMLTIQEIHHSMHHPTEITLIDHVLRTAKRHGKSRFRMHTVNGTEYWEMTDKIANPKTTSRHPPQHPDIHQHTPSHMQNQTNMQPLTRTIRTLMRIELPDESMTTEMIARFLSHNHTLADIDQCLQTSMTGSNRTFTATQINHSTYWHITDLSE